MENRKWNAVTSEDVLQAIHIYDTEHPEHPEARNTFLLYNRKKYPAKHIRAMAFKVHYGIEISKSEFSGGAETATFFRKLGFEVRYTPTHTGIHPVEQLQVPVRKNNLKICLFLQETSGFESQIKRHFQKATKLVHSSDIDILVFPEFCYLPYRDKFYRSDFSQPEDLQQLIDYTMEYSKELGKAVVVCGQDRCGRIMSIFANADALKDETSCQCYMKHTMTDKSPLGEKNYQFIAEDMFQPILFHGWRIGMTICYDCNHSIFSRKYGLHHVDILLNCTGGDVIYDKWHKYNQARAIENHCFTFVTMRASAQEKSYVYGFTPTGKEMHPDLLNGMDQEKHNVSNGIYVYNTAEDDGTSEAEHSFNQMQSINKHQDMTVPAREILTFFEEAEPITDNIHIFRHGDTNVVLCLVEGEDICRPECVLRLLYAKELRTLPNKRYLILNHWKDLENERFKNQVSLLLKVRAMENYCAVLLHTNQFSRCYQTGQNRTAQVIQEVHGQFGLDLSRMGGPDTIWKNKNGMRAEWRDNVEWLIASMQEES